MSVYVAAEDHESKYADAKVGTCAPGMSRCPVTDEDVKSKVHEEITDIDATSVVEAGAKTDMEAVDACVKLDAHAARAATCASTSVDVLAGCSGGCGQCAMHGRLEGSYCLAARDVLVRCSPCTRDASGCTSWKAGDT